MDLQSLKENSIFKDWWSFKFIAVVVVIAIIMFFKEFTVLAGIAAIVVVIKYLQPRRITKMRYY